MYKFLYKIPSSYYFYPWKEENILMQRSNYSINNLFVYDMQEHHVVNWDSECTIMSLVYMYGS